jgi:serine/threonine-protein kinase HipA
MRLRQLFPKQALTAMHLLALVGANGIGRLGYALPGHAPAPNASVLSRQTLLETAFTAKAFDDLVSTYLSTGAGIAGMQPKIMVPDRPTISIPTLIVKAGSQAYPGLAANEFLCLRAAQRAGIQTPDFDLSYDGQLLLLDRFDIEPDGQRLGFEDIASLMGLRVRDTLADRKYHGSYQRIADVLKLLQLPEVNLHRFFEQVAFTIMVRNGDGHLKNYGVLYRTPQDIWLAPMFDVVTTSIYRYQRYGGGPELEDRTMALKLFSGKGQTRSYPDTAELLRFGRTVCGVERPGAVLEKIAQAMASVLDDARNDVRVPVATLAAMRDAWLIGMTYAAEAARTAVKHIA